MKGDKKVIYIFNKVLRHQLTSINQYFLHARMFKSWGLEELDDFQYKQSLRTMHDADRLLQRILELEGLPKLEKMGSLQIGGNIVECLQNDLANEKNVQRPLLLKAMAVCEYYQDYDSRELFAELLTHSEAAISWLESQGDLSKAG